MTELKHYQVNNAIIIAQEFFLDMPEPEHLVIKEIQIDDSTRYVCVNELREGEMQEIYLLIYRQGRYALAYHPEEGVLLVAIAD